MVNPLWLLLTWALVVLSAGVKFWRLTSAWRQRGKASTNQADTDAARQSLERPWLQLACQTQNRASTDSVVNSAFNV